MPLLNNQFVTECLQFYQTTKIAAPVYQNPLKKTYIHSTRLYVLLQEYKFRLYLAAYQNSMRYKYRSLIATTKNL